MAPELNDIQIQILDALNENPRMSITGISKQVEASRPTVMKILKSMIKDEVLLISSGINANSHNYQISKLGIYVSSPEKRAQIIDILINCPKVLNIYRISDQANLLLELYGPDKKSLTSIINCIGDLEHVEIKYHHYLGEPLKNVSIPIIIGDNSNTPCGKNCNICFNNHNTWCNGCYTFQK
jgi:DNA-binding Lrp family transcriptional regulator